MYIPAAFEVAEHDLISAFLKEVPFGCLVTHGLEGLFASHLPFLYQAEPSMLVGHLAAANPHQGKAGNEEALAIFQGPNAYVSPGWYPSKIEHGKVVPTWNYEVIHVYGRLTWHNSAIWLRSFVSKLTDTFEAAQNHPWSISDAPDDYIERQLGVIVGVELHITRIEAKRKLSQNRSEQDQQGVRTALANSADVRDVAVSKAMCRTSARP